MLDHVHIKAWGLFFYVFDLLMTGILREMQFIHLNNSSWVNQIESAHLASKEPVQEAGSKWSENSVQNEDLPKRHTSL